MAKLLKDAEGSPVKYLGQDVFGCDYAGVVKGVDIERRQLTMIGTDESKDRDGDIIRLSGWNLDNYKKNPVFLWAHNYGSVPIARAEKITKKREPPRMEFLLQFPTKGIYPFADMILDLYFEKIINTSSVGFIPTKWNPIEEEANDSNRYSYGREFISQELLELSGCAVPSNPNAVQNALKGRTFGFKQDDLLKYLTGGTLIPRPEKEVDVLAELDKSETEFVDETSIQVQVLDTLSPPIDTPTSASIAIVPTKVADDVVVLPEGVPPSAEEKVDVVTIIKDNKEDSPPEDDPEDDQNETMMAEIGSKLDTLISSVASIDQTIQSLVESLKGIQASLTKVNGENTDTPDKGGSSSVTVLREAFRKGKVKVEPTPQPSAGTNVGNKPELIKELKSAVSDLSKAIKAIKL